MNLRKLKQVFKSDAFRQVRKFVVAIVGTIVILVGFILFFIPGPALVVIPAGFGILALEFGWARTWLKKTMAAIKYLSSPKNLKRLLYENSLSLVLFFLFLVCFIGQLATGQHDYNQERFARGQSPLPILEYLTSGHAIEATFENWESEFFQMGALVIFTVYLRQKGAADSQGLRSRKAGSSATTRAKANAPWPVRKGGWILTAYEHSLSLSLFALFFISFVLHAVGGRHLYNEEQLFSGGTAVSFWQYLGTARFWFESFQNWQSEFLSVGVLLVLSIFLRERGSPQSKRINAPYFETGSQEPGIPALAPSGK